MREATCVVVIPAKDEEQRIAATVRAARSLPEAALVIVVDDGSADGTARAARQEGALVTVHPQRRGKGAAMATGAALAIAQGYGELPLLFADADLEETASALGVLVQPVLRGEVDLTIALLPRQQTSAGGHGFVVRLAREGIQTLTGWRPRQPLSGMRCLTREAFAAASPLARGWGVEAAMTVDVLTAGLRVREVPCPLQHRVSESGWRAQLHRAEQYRDVWVALARRRVHHRLQAQRA